MMDTLKILPHKAFQQIEFTDILNAIATHAIGKLAQQKIHSTTVGTNPQWIRQEFSPLREMIRLASADIDIPLQPYEDISSSAEKLAIKNYILEIDEVREIYRMLLTLREAKQSILSFTDPEAPILSEMVRRTSIPEKVIRFAERIFDEDFAIRKDASPDLLRLHHAIEATKRRLNSHFQELYKKYASTHWLTDTAESIRNGKRVFAVKAEFKRRIKGVLHDESSTGKVAYIEPQEILDINNDIFDLQQERKREIFRLMREMCSFMAEYRASFLDCQQLLVQLDVLRAKTIFAKHIQAICPEVEDIPKLKIIRGRHPLLLLRQEVSDVVPFNLEFYKDNRLLLVSGPNAGGKTILMKAVGLLQLMVQSCIPVPVAEQSRFGVFHSFMVDIGDQQSIEDDLSTYSSHLYNMNQFLQQADSKSLILIDEMGSGTDPRLGGAIAEAILHELLSKGVHGIVTTHYSNLKSYAHRTKKIVNGAMAFDQEHFTPTYELIIGKPGSSFAFELAEKCKLPSYVIRQAKKNAGKSIVNIDQMLADIQKQRSSLAEKAKEVDASRREAELMRMTFEQMKKELEGQRQRLKMLRKEYDLHQNELAKNELRQLIRKLEKKKNIEKAKAVEQQLKQEQEKHTRQLHKLEQKDWESRQQHWEKPIEVGSYVKVRKTGTIGQVMRLDKKKAVVQTGTFELEVKVSDLHPIKEPIEKKNKSISLDIQQQAHSIKPKLDVRGLPRQEADRLLDSYLDAVVMSTHPSVRIIHGIGSGVLRKLVREKALALNAFTSIDHPPQEQGGLGVTILTL